MIRLSYFLGIQRIIYGCYDKATDEKVNDQECQFIDGPKSEDVECERIGCAALAYVKENIVQRAHGVHTTSNDVASTLMRRMTLYRR